MYMVSSVENLKKINIAKKMSDLFFCHCFLNFCKIRKKKIEKNDLTSLQVSLGPGLPVLFIILCKM